MLASLSSLLFDGILAAFGLVGLVVVRFLWFTVTVRRRGLG